MHKWHMKIALLALVFGAAVADWETKFSQDLSGPSRDFADENLFRSSYSEEATVPFSPFGYLLFPAYSSLETLNAFLYDYQGNEETSVNVFDIKGTPCTRFTSEDGQEEIIPIVVFGSISQIDLEIDQYQGPVGCAATVKIQWNIEERSYYQNCTLDGFPNCPQSLSCSSFDNDTVLLAFHSDSSNDAFGYCMINIGNDFQPSTVVVNGKITEIDSNITITNSRFKGLLHSANAEIQLVLASDYLFINDSGTTLFEQAIIYNVSFDALVNQTSSAIGLSPVFLVPKLNNASSSSPLFKGDVYSVSKDLCGNVSSLCDSVFAISAFEISRSTISVDVVQVQYGSKRSLLDSYEISKTALLEGQYEVAIAVNSSGILLACLAYGQYMGSNTNLVLNFASTDLTENKQHLTWTETDGLVNITEYLKDFENLTAIELQLAPIESVDFQGFQIIIAFTTTSETVKKSYLRVRNFELWEIVETVEVSDEEEERYYGTEVLAELLSVAGVLSGFSLVISSILALLESEIGAGAGTGGKAISGDSSSLDPGNILSCFLDLCQGSAFQGMLSVKHPAFLRQYWKGFGWTIGLIPLPGLYGSVPSSLRRLLQNTNSYDDGISRFSTLVGVPPENMFFTVLTVFCALEVIVFLLFEFLFYLSKKLQNRIRGSLRRFLNQSHLHPRDLEIGLMLRVANFAFSSLSLVAIYSVTQSLNTSRAEASFALSIITMIACAVYLVMGVVKVRKRGAADLQNLKSKVKYGVFYSDFRYDWRLFFVTMSLYKLLCSLLISFLRDHPYAQLGTLVAVHAVFLLCVLISRPYIDKFRMMVVLLTTTILLIQVTLAFGLIEEGPNASVIGGFTLALSLISMILFISQFFRRIFKAMNRRVFRKNPATANPTELAKVENAASSAEPGALSAEPVKVYQAQFADS